MLICQTFRRSYSVRHSSYWSGVKPFANIRCLASSNLHHERENVWRVFNTASCCLPDAIGVGHFSDDTINSINRLHIPTVKIATMLCNLLVNK